MNKHMSTKLLPLTIYAIVTILLLYIHLTSQMAEPSTLYVMTTLTTAAPGGVHAFYRTLFFNPRWAETC